MRTKREKQKLAAKMRKMFGIEITPDECDKELSFAYAIIRKHMADKGWEMPEDDNELSDIIRQAIKVVYYA